MSRPAEHPVDDLAVAAMPSAADPQLASPQHADPEILSSQSVDLDLATPQHVDPDLATPALADDDALLAEVRRLAQPEEHAEPLPRHRHHLARAHVETTQRARIILATAEVVTEQSYAKTTTRDIVKAAGVSSKTFYAHYDGKEQAFLAAYTLLDSTMLALAQAPVDLSHPRTDLRRHVEAWLGALAAWPLFARMRFIEGRAAGPAADRYRSQMARNVVAAFGAGLDEAARRDPRIVRPSDGVLALLYGGITEQLTRWVTERDPADLVQLAPAIVETIERLCVLELPAYAAGE